MKILHVHEVYLPYKGGSAIRISKLLENQKEKYEDEIYVLCSYKGISKNTPKKEVIKGVNILRVKNFNLCVIHLFIFLLKNKIDVIHIHNTRVFTFLFPLFFLKKMILEIHSLKKLKGYKEYLQKLSIRFAYKIVVLSNQTKFFLEKHYNVKKEKIFTVINGVDDFDNEKIKNIKNNEVVYAGSLYEWQGLKMLLEVASISESIKDNIKYKIIGEGPFLNFIKDYIKKNKLEERVVLIPFLEKEKLIKELNKSKIFLLLRPKLRQTELTFPLKILEIGKMNLPLVMTKRAAHLEVFKDEKDALNYVNLVEDDSIIIHSTITSDLKNYNHLVKKANKFLNYINFKGFTWSDSSKKYREVYD